MCNARNHSASCDCGFGPPYPGKVETVERIDWIEEIVTDKGSFKRALNDLNFDSKSVREYLEEYHSIINLHEPRATILERLKALIDRREYRTEEFTPFYLNVPLFKLHSPTVDGAKSHIANPILLITGRGGWSSFLESAWVELRQ
jgi:hypothetical protein